MADKFKAKVYSLYPGLSEAKFPKLRAAKTESHEIRVWKEHVLEVNVLPFQQFR
jgi:hypothetical protein